MSSFAKPRSSKIQTVQFDGSNRVCVCQGMEALKSTIQACCILAALFIATFNNHAAARRAPVAPVALTCQSMNGQSTPHEGRQLMFSTSDTAPGLPQHIVGTNGNLIMNGELRPVTNGVGVYETDVAAIPASVDLSQVRSTDVLFGGKLHFNFPTNDVDTNGVVDFLQFEKGANVYLTGGGITEYSSNGQSFHTSIPHESAWADGAGLVGGLAYQWEIVEGDAYLDSRGILEPLYMTGSVTNRGTTLVFGLASTDPLGRASSFGAFNYKGIAPAHIRAHGDELRIGQFNLKRSDGVKLKVNKTTLRRVNGKYIGKLTFKDWNPETPWADYTEWAIEVGEFVRPTAASVGGN
jgi:hypothetical protein